MGDREPVGVEPFGRRHSQPARRRSIVPRPLASAVRDRRARNPLVPRSSCRCRSRLPSRPLASAPAGRRQALPGNCTTARLTAWRRAAGKCRPCPRGRRALPVCASCLRQPRSKLRIRSGSRGTRRVALPLRVYRQRRATFAPGAARSRPVRRRRGLGAAYYPVRFPVAMRPVFRTALQEGQERKASREGAARHVRSRRSMAHLLAEPTGRTVR